MAKYIVTGEQYFDIDGQMLEIKRQLRQKGGSPIKPEDIILALQDVVEGKFNCGKKIVSQFLRPIIIDGKIILDVCDGNETIADAKKVFTVDIDIDFKNYGANETGATTKQIEVQVLDLVKNATFPQMFCLSNTDLEKLCLTHKQIINFCKRFKQHLSKTGVTFFLFKVNDQFFVAFVHVRGGDSLDVRVSRFGHDGFWFAKDGSRVVVPQQAL